jgi:hypothetical protein
VIDSIKCSHLSSVFSFVWIKYRHFLHISLSLFWMMMFARTTTASSARSAVFATQRKRQSSSRVCNTNNNSACGERRRIIRTNWNLLSSSSSSSALRAVAKPPGEEDEDVALPDEVKDLKLQDIISLWVTQILQTYGDKPSSDNAPIVEGEIDDLVGGPIFLALYPYFRCVFCFRLATRCGFCFSVFSLLRSVCFVRARCVYLYSSMFDF